MKSRLIALMGIVLCAQGVAAHANPNGPAEQNALSLTRTSVTPLVMSADMSKNLYRNIEREVVETVPVAYEEQVPYTDYETTYTTEQRCTTTYSQVCQNNNRCYPGTPGRRVCSNRQVCRATPQGQVCQNFPSCHMEPGTPPYCRNEPVCRTEPHQVCRLEQVPHQRAVTRYRTETRYRDETRTRTVVEQVFISQFTARVEVVFPANALLDYGQEEILNLRLSGTPEAPMPQVIVQSPYRGYKVTGLDRPGRNIVRVFLAVGGAPQPITPPEEPYSDGESYYEE